MTGSVSKGRWGGRYPYYHCTTGKCIGRFKANKLNNSYEEILKKLHIRSEVFQLFDLVLEDENIFTCRKEYTDERKKIKNDISKQELYISKARKYFLDEKIDFDDFRKLKQEYNEILCQLNIQLESITQKIANCELNNNFWPDTEFTIFRSYKDQDIKGKRDIISLFSPGSINAAIGKIDSLKINEALSLIIECH